MMQYSHLGPEPINWWASAVVLLLGLALIFGPRLSAWLRSVWRRRGR